jgi:hypothetical protein
VTAAFQRERVVTNETKEMTMKLIRALFLMLAVLLPTSWTIAHAEGMGGVSGETKKKSKKKKKDAGGMGGMKGEDAK